MDLPKTDAEWERFWEDYTKRRRRKPRTTGPRGVPVPGTGVRNIHRRTHKIPAYARPRKGGGRNHRGVEDWRHGHTGPLE